MSKKKKYEYYWALHDTINDVFLVRDQFFDKFQAKLYSSILDAIEPSFYSRLATVDFVQDNYSKDEADLFLSSGYNSRFRLFRGNLLVSV